MRSRRRSWRRRRRSSLRLGVDGARGSRTAGTRSSPRRRRGGCTAAVAFDSRPAETRGGARGVDEVALLQNFVGWEVDAGRPVFDEGVVEMMDFAVSQARGLHFMYVLPFSPRRALVEATYITPGGGVAQGAVRGGHSRVPGARGTGPRTRFEVVFRERGHDPHDHGADAAARRRRGSCTSGCAAGWPSRRPGTRSRRSRSIIAPSTASSGGVTDAIANDSALPLPATVLPNR
jgi:hypothetical protein